MKNLFFVLLFTGIATIYFSCSDYTSAPDVNQINQSLTKGPPADGNGIKYVEEINDSWTTDCGLDANLTGWFQFKEFGQGNNRNIDLTVYHLVFTYTNSDGEEFTWHDVGPDHYYWVGDDLYVSVTGRSTGSGVIGHCVFNVSQDETIQVSGKEFGDIDAYACSMLN